MKKILILMVLFCGVIKFSFGQVQAPKVTNTEARKDGVLVEYKICYDHNIKCSDMPTVKIKIKGVNGDYYEYSTPVTDDYRNKELRGHILIKCDNATATRCNINDVEITFSYQGKWYKEG